MNTSMNLVNRILGIVSFVFGLIILFSSWGMGIMGSDGVPGPGFLPIILGILMVLLGGVIVVITFGKSVKSEPLDISKEEIENFVIVLGGCIFTMIGTKLIGLLPSLGIMSGIMAYLLKERRLKVVILIAILTPIAMYLIFGAALSVKFPRGLII